MKKITYLYFVKSKFLKLTKTFLFFLVILFTLFSYSSVLNTWSHNIYSQISTYFMPPVVVPCNTDLPVPITLPNYTDLSVSSSTSGLCLLSCGIQNASNLIDSNEGNFALANTGVGLGVTHTLKVTDNTIGEFYSSGSYAGFLVENSSALQVDLLKGLVIRTYLDGVFQEYKSNTSLVAVNTTLLGSNKYYVGFYTTKNYDAIEISVSGTVGVLDATRIYHAVTNSFCAAPILECNTPTTLAKPLFPARIVDEHTGMGGLLNVGSVNNAISAIDSDSNSYASIDFVLGAFATGNLSIKDELTNYVAKTYVGFDIENTSILNLDLLAGITLTTYLDGTLQETKSGASELLSVDSGLLFTGTERSQVGFVTTLPFDEVQLSIQQTVSLNLGSTHIYGLVVESFCEGFLDCSSATVLSNPSQPVIINSIRTGVDGLVCVGCEVDNATNVISESNSDFATINVVAGVANTASISVENALSSFPAGSEAGFIIRDTNDLLEVDLLNSLTITTYLNGAVQEFQTGSNLLALQALGLINITPSTSNGFNLIGFETSLEYDEVRLTVNALAAVINSIEVYGSYVNTSIKIESTIINETAIGASNGSLAVTVSGGTPPYSYLWSPGAETSNAINNLSPGIYSVTITDSKGCDATADFTIYTDGVQYPVACNTDTPVAITSAGFTDLSVTKNTIGTCIVGCAILNEGNLIDADESNYATLTTLVGLGVKHSLKIADDTSSENFTANGFAGFLIENSSVLQADLLNAIIIRTYLDGILQESSTSGTLVALNTTLLGSNKYDVGFYTTQNYDAIEIEVSSLAGILSTTKVYHAVTSSFCAGPDLVCNTATSITKTNFPVRIVDEHTGLGGLLGVGSVDNSGNVIDSDAHNYATINLLAGVAANASLAIKDEIAEYPATTFAGFDIENTTILQTELFDAITISTYLNGVFVESKTGTTELLPVNSGLLLTGSESTRLGFVSSAPFDEVQITLSQLVSLHLGNTRIYGVVLESFCEGTINCDAPYVPTNPDNSVIVNNARSGFDGLVCVACEVENTQNVISANNADYATINVVAGVAGTGSISVKDILLDYPSNTFAGFVIRDTNNLLEVDLLNSIIITTYLDDSQQEQQTSGNLLALNALGLINITPTSTTGFNVVGFNTTLPFDEVRITVASLVGVLNSIEVYGEYIDATNSVFCQTADIALIKTAVFNDEDSDSCSDLGETISYTFTLTNTGNSSITNVVLTDAMLGGVIALTSGDTDSDSELDVNETWLYTSNYIITQANIDAGLVSNQASITGTSTGGIIVNDLSDDDSILENDATETTLCKTEVIGLIKKGNINTSEPSGCSVIGDTIDFVFSVTNEGNTTLKSVSVIDLHPGLGAITFSSGDDDNDGELDVNEIWIYNASYIITSADILSANVTNQATVTAIGVSGNSVTDLSDDNSVVEDDQTIVALCQTPNIALVKTAKFNDEDTDGCTDVNETLTYTMLVTNEGNTGLMNVVLTDAMLGGVLTLTSGDLNNNNILNVGEVWMYTSVYALTQANIDAGIITNQAEVSGESSLNVVVTDLSDNNSILEDDVTETTLCQNADIALIKTGIFNDEDFDSCSDSGETITYAFTLINTGNSSITNVVLTDVMLGGTIALASGDLDSDNELDVTETWIYTSNYTITQVNIDAGLVSNQASVTGISIGGVVVNDLSDNDSFLEDDATVTTLCISNSSSGSISLEKISVFNDENNNSTAEVDETITYSFTIYNTGETTLYNITLEDALPGIIIQGGTIAQLLPGEEDNSTFTATYTITQQDIINKTITNQAIVTAEDILGNPVTDTSDDPNNFDDIDINNDGEPDDPTITVLPSVGSSDFEIFNAMSPDSDGLNDFFRIEGIDKFPDNNLKIYNRWGVLIYEMDAYGIDNKVFRGMSEGRVTVSKNELLPTGTYFYILTRFVANKDPLVNKGYLYIKRN